MIPLSSLSPQRQLGLIIISTAPRPNTSSCVPHVSTLAHLHSAGLTLDRGRYGPWALTFDMTNLRFAFFYIWRHKHKHGLLCYARLGYLEYLGHNIMAMWLRHTAMEEHGTGDCVLDVEEEGHRSDGGGSELASSVDTLLDNTYFDDEDLNEEQTCKRCVTSFDNLYKGRADFWRPYRFIDDTV